MNILELNNSFAIPNQITFKSGKGNLPIAEISNNVASATVSLYGAHVLSYKPKNEKEILWLSEKCMFEVGKPIRGDSSLLSVVWSAPLEFNKTG